MLLSCQGQEEEPAPWLWLRGEQFFETFSFAVLILCRMLHYTKCKLSLATWPFGHSSSCNSIYVVNFFYPSKAEMWGRRVSSTSHCPLVFWNSPQTTLQPKQRSDVPLEHPVTPPPWSPSSYIVAVTMNELETSFHVGKPKELVHYRTFMACNHKFVWFV